MASSSSLLTATTTTTNLGNTISLKMVHFLDTVRSQPLGFTDLGHDFLSLSQILNTLSSSLSLSHKPLPAQAVPELSSIMSATLSDFQTLDALLEKFMEFEKGGAFARLQKGWRLLVADREIARVRGGLNANRGALRMAMLLIDLNPNERNVPVGAEFTALARKLQHGPAFEEMVSGPTVAELPGGERPPQELGNTSVYEASVSETVSAADGSGSQYHDAGEVVTPSISDMSISDRIPATPLVAAKDRAIPMVAEEDAEVPPGPIVPGKPLIIVVDLSKVPRRVPKAITGAGNAILEKALLSAIVNNKSTIVEQLLDRGISPAIGLYEAATLSDPTVLHLLLEFGALPDAKTANGLMPLRRACELSQEESAKLLLHYGADPNLLAPDLSPLFWAIHSKKEGLVRLLLEYGGDPDLEMGNGSTVTKTACEHSIPLEVVRLVLRYSSDLDKKTRHGQTALWCACIQNRPEVIKILLQAGADPNLPGPQLPIEAAAQYPACLQALIQGGADLKKKEGILEIAVARNSVESMKLLLEAGCDPNEKSQNIFSPLTTAIRDNRPEIMKLLLSKGADPNMKGQEMPLALATHHPAILQILLAHGVDLTKCPGSVERAVANNKLKSVRMLLDAGADINFQNQGIYTPLTTAVRDNRAVILALLLERGADPDLKGQDKPLILATQKVEILKQLVEGGADLSKCPGVMESAVCRNQIESVRYLLDQGVSSQDKNQGLYTPLGTAVRDNRGPILALLLERGADPNFKGQDYPLVLAIPNPKILKKLIEGGANVGSYKGLLEIAVYQNKMESVEILLDAGVDVNEKHRDFCSPLTTAIRDNRIPILKVLLAKGADVSLPGEALPLVLAARLKDVERMKILLDAGAEKDVVWKGRTALMEASERGWVDGVKLLLGRGADVGIVNGGGNGAMDIAASAGQDEIVMLLLEAID